MASRASRTTYVFPGQFAARWQAVPMPDSPAPTIRTSTCSRSTAGGSMACRGPATNGELAQRVVEEADDAPLVLPRPGVDSAGVLRLGDLPERLGLLRR